MNESKKTKSINELCYKLYTKDDRNTSLLQDYCVYLDISLDEFLKHVVDYINDNSKLPEYVKILDNLANINNNQMVIEYLDSVSINYKNLRENLMSYFINYRPDIYYTMPHLKQLLSDNLSFYATHVAKLNRPLNCKEIEIDDYANEIINDYVNNNYSIRRFCFNKNITTTNFKNYLNKVKKTNPTLFEKCVEETNLREQIKETNIKNDVYEILNKIKENPDFSIIDFLLMTNYDVLEIVSAADQLIFNEDIKLFRKTVRPFRFINKLSERQINNLINSNFVFNINNELIKVSEEDKLYVLTFLKENNIPISNETFKDGCIKKLLNQLTKECLK